MKKLLGKKSKGKGQKEIPAVLQLNVGGTQFTTQKTTLLKEPDTLFHVFFGGFGEVPPLDPEGRYFLDRDGKFFGLILSFLRDDQAELPLLFSGDWNALKREAEYYRVLSLIEKMEAEEQERPRRDSDISLRRSSVSDPKETNRATELKVELERRVHDIERRLEEDSVDEHTKDLLALELKKVHLEMDRVKIQSKNKGRELIYNLLIVGVTGTGKSSSINTLLDSPECAISGAQAQGTRGCVLRDASLDPDHFVSYIDTQGLGADTSISDTDLLSQIMLSTESILNMGIINNILISFDVNARTTPAIMANQLTLMELFSDLKRSCFLVFTKWNTNAVQVEWNTPLREWVRRWKRAGSVEEITEDPPSYEDMYHAFCTYVIDALANEMDGGAFSKMGAFIGFFEARVLFMYNLDGILLEDKEEGCLDPYISRLYYFYRNKAMDTLDRGSTTIITDDLIFLKNDEVAMRTVAAQLIRNRDEKIKQLEQVGRETKKRREMKIIFNNMAEEHTARIYAKDFHADTGYTKKIAVLAGFISAVSHAGCVIQ